MPVTLPGDGAVIATVDVAGALQQLVQVTNLPATQPVSGTVALDAPSLAALETVSVANFPGSQAVTGTFWQATQPVSGPLTDAQLRAAALPLPVGAATEATLLDAVSSLAQKVDSEAIALSTAGINAKTPALGQSTSANSSPVVLASDAGVRLDMGGNRLATDADGLRVRASAMRAQRYGFDKTFASGVDTAVMAVVGAVGAGMAVSQASGSLVMTSGTTANSETIVRSLSSFAGDIVLRYATNLSQRIANNNFMVELVDVLGDALAFTINSATSVTVTFPVTNPFTALQNVGQSVNIGAISGAAGVPGRWAIASVSGLTVTFTVAGWPATGSGTCSLFGWNYNQVIYNGTTATSANWDTQRNGWASGATTATINTTASTHVVTIANSESEAVLMDQTGASATGLEVTRRASRVRNVPDATVALFLQLRAMNGTAAPATTTTWTAGFADVDVIEAQSVSLSNVSTLSANSGMPVEVVNTTTVTGTVTATVASTTVTASTPATPTASNINSAATTNATAVKTSAGTVFSVTAFNSGAAVAFVKFYNKASAPTVGTDVPVITIPVAAAGFISFELGPMGHRFTTGIALAITNLAADSDATAVAAAQVKVLVSYI